MGFQNQAQKEIFHTNVDDEAEVWHMDTHTGAVGAHQHLNVPGSKNHLYMNNYTNFQDPLRKLAMILSLSSLLSSPLNLAMADLLGIKYLVESSAHLSRSHPAAQKIKRW